MKHLIFSICIVIILSACAHQTGTNFKKKNQQIRQFITEQKIDSQDRINSFRFHGWNNITNTFLIISTSPKRKFLIELMGLCSDVYWAQTIMINRALSGTLQTKIDNISTLESPNQSCRIKHIYPVSKEQLTRIKAIKNTKKNE